MDYRPDDIADSIDLMIATASGPEPVCDQVLRDFLLQSYQELGDRCKQGGLLQVRSLGRNLPWLFRLTFSTRGLVRHADTGDIQEIQSHTIALRFLPDYLRVANRFEMLRLIEPARPPIFHPNICPHTGAVCVEIYPGESLLAIVESLHDLLRWRLRQYDERDALNKEACAWGRDHVNTPIDGRPLFGRSLQIELEVVGETR